MFQTPKRRRVGTTSARSLKTTAWKFSKSTQSAHTQKMTSVPSRTAARGRYCEKSAYGLNVPLAQPDRCMLASPQENGISLAPFKLTK
jgi:hypothetical protein